METTEFFGSGRIGKILLKLAPPVMLAQLIQALYNIIDSLFIGRYSDSGLTALSVIYPVQLLMIALAVGTGVGINTAIAAAAIVARKGFRKPPAKERYPRHIARIFRLGIPNILMQSAYTFYIFGLNLILAGFSDQAVTALGLYYKWQTFFFIPLGAMQTCIVPVISFNFAAGNIDRCKRMLTAAIGFGLALMAVGTICFTTIPVQKYWCRWEAGATAMFLWKMCSWRPPLTTTNSRGWQKISSPCAGNTASTGWTWIGSTPGWTVTAPSGMRPL